MQRHPQYTRARLSQFAGQLKELIYAQKKEADRILVSPRVDRISYAEAQHLEYRPVKFGEQFGPAWATFWFRVEAVVPEAWKGRRIDLLWNSHSEATLWVNGRTIQGLNFHAGDRPDAVMLEKAAGGETLRFEIEMACNGKFGIRGNPHSWSLSHYVLDQCAIAAFDPAAWELYHDYLVLQELDAEILKSGGSLDQSWGGLLLSELNRFVNAIRLNDRASWDEAHAILKILYHNRNASVVHELSAIGHAHIDTAWLWPLAETERKCERTFSTQTAYMRDYPDYRFSCSQAYQYEVIKRRNPDLYDRIKKHVKSGQFVPVGGTWIEPDCNIPSGEALARQFLYGQRFFEKEFGFRCREFWNPDVFGYNGQLPQIMKLAGITRFLTQKLSWNRFNKPHHHTFTWEGIDGSEVLAHFPPADTYNAMADVAEIVRNAREYKDHDRSRHSLMLFGYGDGGGGPTKTMIETLRRAKDLQGLPRTAMRTSNEFFDLLEKDNTDRVRQVGELYFEYHRGTYTSEAYTKKANRKCEFLLHDVEFLSTVAAKTASLPYPRAPLESLWKLLLLNQFHDILPGSSITEVYTDNRRQMEQIKTEGGKLRDAALKAIGGSSPRGKTFSPVNTIGFARAEVAELPTGELVYVEAPSYGIGRIVASTPDAVKVTESRGRFVLENAHLRAELSGEGCLLSLVEKSTGRETMAGAGNQLLVYRDEPTEHEAWDVEPQDLETETACPPADSAKVVENGSLRAGIHFERKIAAKSVLRQTARLAAGSRRLEFHTVVDWDEQRTMLKVAFPVVVRAMNATYEMQFGSVERPTHYNTMYDLARFEVPGHKWADLSEYGFGVALLSESKYGFSTLGNTMRMTLLRATKYPDPVADLGRHEFTYAIMPHARTWREADVVGEGYRFNVPMLFAEGAASARSFASVEDPNLVLDTIKQAEDDDSIVLRLYECHGSRGIAKVKIEIPFKRAVFCNILEEEGQKAQLGQDGAIEVPYGPYQVIGVKLKS